METHGSVGALRASAVARVGQAVNVAVERFVTVGETIADDYPEVRDGMYEACKEARQAGERIGIDNFKIFIIAPRWAPIVFVWTEAERN